MPRKLRSTPTLELLDFTFDICCKSWSCELHQQQEITMFVAKTTCNLSILCICLLHCPTCLGSTQKYVLARKKATTSGQSTVHTGIYICMQLYIVYRTYIYIYMYCCFLMLLAFRIKWLRFMLYLHCSRSLHFFGSPSCGLFY